MFRELQDINYPILWGGQHERHINWALVSPTPQELIGYFFIWKSLIQNNESTIRNPTFHTARLVELDWLAVHQYASDREVVRYLTFGPNSEEDTKNFLQREISLQGEEPRQHFALAVTLKAQKHLIGICRISVKDTANKTGSIGYSFTKEFWGQGYATEAVKAIVSFGFQELDLHRIFATCHPENIASARIMQKIGMQQEGYLREHHWIKGKWRDS